MSEHYGKGWYMTPNPVRPALGIHASIMINGETYPIDIDDLNIEMGWAYNRNSEFGDVALKLSGSIRVRDPHWTPADKPAKVKRPKAGQSMLDIQDEPEDDE